MKDKKYFKNSNYDMLWIKEVIIKKNPKDAKLIAGFVKPKKGELILEIGSGEGRIGCFIIKRKATYIGIDISRRMLLFAKRKLFKKGSYNLILADAENLPFKNDAFDKVFCFATSWFIPHQDLLISEAYRVLKINGIFCCEFRNFQNSYVAYRYRIRISLNKILKTIRFLRLKSFVKYLLLPFFIISHQKYGRDKDWLESFLEYGMTPFFPIDPFHIQRIYYNCGFIIKRINSNLRKTILEEKRINKNIFNTNNKIDSSATLIITPIKK